MILICLDILYLFLLLQEQFGVLQESFLKDKYLLGTYQKYKYLYPLENNWHFHFHDAHKNHRDLYLLDYLYLLDLKQDFLQAFLLSEDIFGYETHLKWLDQLNEEVQHLV